jgi:hypothetical protein
MTSRPYNDHAIVSPLFGTKVAEIKFADSAAFLGHTEHDRNGAIGTRNCRLAAIRSFFHFSAPRSSPHRSSTPRSRALMEEGRKRARLVGFALSDLRHSGLGLW